VRFLDKWAVVIVVLSLILLSMITSGCARQIVVVRENSVMELSRDYIVPVWNTSTDPWTEVWVELRQQDTVVRGHVDD